MKDKLTFKNLVALAVAAFFIGLFYYGGSPTMSEVDSDPTGYYIALIPIVGILIAVGISYAVKLIRKWLK